jgi:hypothetical protein
MVFPALVIGNTELASLELGFLLQVPLWYSSVYHCVLFACGMALVLWASGSAGFARRLLLDEKGSEDEQISQKVFLRQYGNFCAPPACTALSSASSFVGRIVG